MRMGPDAEQSILWTGDGEVTQGVGWHWSLISSFFLPHFYLTQRVKIILTHKLIYKLRIKCAVQKSWILLLKKSNCPLYSFYRQKSWKE